MKLITKCQTCSAQIKTWNLSPDRVDFAKTTGEFVELNCKRCLTKNNYHVDELEATPSTIIYLIAGIILLIATPLVIQFLWPYLDHSSTIYQFMSVFELSTVPVIIYALLLKGDRNRVRRFNRHKFKR